MVVNGVESPSQFQAAIVSRFMDRDQYARFVEAYRSKCKVSFGGHVKRDLPEKYYSWLEQYSTGTPLKEIANRAGVSSKIIYNAIKTAALRKQLA